MGGHAASTARPGRIATLWRSRHVEETPLARAKRTDRAEARRRYRAHLATEDDAGLEEPGDDAPTQRPGGPNRPPTAAQPATPARPGLMSAFSKSFRPLDLRGDLAYLPTLLRHRSVIVPSLISIISTIAVVTVIVPRLDAPQPSTSILDSLGFYIYEIFVWTPIGAGFLAGFLAQRAGWLAGLVVTVVASVCFALSWPALETLAEGVDLQNTVAQSILFSLPTGALAGAFAAWYRRFLATISPNRQRRAQGKSSRGARNARPVRGR
jgi:hypothetical protein